MEILQIVKNSSKLAVVSIVKNNVIFQNTNDPGISSEGL